MPIKILIAIVLIFSSAFSQRNRDRVRFSGNAEIGIDFQAMGGLGDAVVHDSRLNRIGTVETEFRFFIADSVILDFDLEFDHRFRNINLKKLFVRYNFDNSNARLGYMKKMFTLEEIKSGNDRLFARKSMINGILSDFHLLGRDFTAQYRYNFPSYTLIGGYSADGSNRHFANITLHSNLINNTTRFVIAGMYMNYLEKGFPEESERRHAFFGNVGMDFSGRRTDFELEAVLGRNPETPIISTWHICNNSEYDFWGVRFQESFPVRIGRKHLNKIVPVYELSFINIFTNTFWQARPGINLNFTERDRLQWRTNLDLNFELRYCNTENTLRNDLISQRIISAIFVKW